MKGDHGFVLQYPDTVATQIDNIFSPLFWLLFIQSFYIKFKYYIALFEYTLKEGPMSVIFNNTFTADKPIYYPSNWETGKTSL